ncbi:MAG: hypothetical protein JSU92_12595 [Deltaproteobacteria bacterium]|nr:MAG: hypothetical protein JSU92_12595 [Deltaproteobacteria bacterium]
MAVNCKMKNCKRVIYTDGMCMEHYSGKRKEGTKKKPRREIGGVKTDVIDKRVVDQWPQNKIKQYIKGSGLPDLRKKADKVDIVLKYRKKY